MECKKGQTKKNRERKSLSGYIFGKRKIFSMQKIN